jgi:CheY-like chemotaxis protein
MQKILVVDDEEKITALLKVYLESTGKYRVHTENSGEGAYTAALEFRPDLIVLDIMMKDLGGDGVANRMRNDPLLYKIPIIFLTGIVTKAEVQANDGMIGGYPYVAKPLLEMREIVDAIEARIGKGRYT